jgi:hypothetical protein
MQIGHWSLTPRSPTPPQQDILFSEAIGAAPRIMMGFAAVLGAWGFWDLLFYPMFIRHLPPLGLLALPFIAMGLLCLGLMLTTGSYAIFARNFSIRIDGPSATIRKELHLVGSYVLTRLFPVSHITRLWLEHDTDSEAILPWRIKLQQRGTKYPLELASFSNAATATAKIDDWRNTIAMKTGINLPT